MIDPSLDATLQQQAVAACQTGQDIITAEIGEVTGIVRAFPTTASLLADWHERPRGTNGPQIVQSPWRERPADQQVVLCYFDGTFTGLPQGPPPPDAPQDRPPHTRLAVAITPAATDPAETFTIVAAGPAANLDASDGPAPPQL